MRIADGIIQFLYNNGVRHSFGIPTSQLSGFNDGLNDFDIEYIVVKNEAAATYSAGRYADTTRDLAVCFLGGCVGVNNGINGIGDAFRNKLPVLIISSFVKSEVMGKNSLQELITTDITEPITKYSKTVFNKDEVMNEVKRAVEICLTPPHGPVHICVPTDIQLSPLHGDIPEKIDRKELLPEFDDEGLYNAIDTINSSQTGVIMVGRGAKGLTSDIKEISEKLRWPIITTPSAKGIINSNFKYNLGNYGWCTTKGAKEYIDNVKVDCLLILGTSLGQMSTRVYNKNLTDGKKVIHIDWDKKEFNKTLKVDIPVFYDLNKAISIINKNIFIKSNSFTKPIINEPYKKNHTGLSLRRFMEKIVDIVPPNTCFVQDMGENMNYALKYMPIKKDMDYQISLHYAAMGTAVGGVIGSYLANPSRPYAVIVGDGAFFMNGMEILTAKEYNLPIMYFVVNNSMFSLVEHGAKALYGRSVKGATTFKQISICEMAKSMGIDAVKVDKLGKINFIAEKISSLNKPMIIELITDGSEVCLDNDRLVKNVEDIERKKDHYPTKEYVIG